MFKSNPTACNARHNLKLKTASKNPGFNSTKKPKSSELDITCACVNKLITIISCVYSLSTTVPDCYFYILYIFMSRNFELFSISLFFFVFVYFFFFCFFIFLLFV